MTTTVFERWAVTARASRPTGGCGRQSFAWWWKTNLGVATLVGSLPGALDVFQILSADSTLMLVLEVRPVPPGRRFAAKEWRIAVSGRFASLSAGPPGQFRVS